MITIKLTRQGGYVVGDGPCPFDPEEFMRMFRHKMIDASARGLTEFGISDEDIQTIAQGMKTAGDLDWDENARTYTFLDNTTPQQLLGVADDLPLPPPQRRIGLA